VEASFVRVAVGDLGVRGQARRTRACDQVVVFGSRRAAGDRVGLVTSQGWQDRRGLTVERDTEIGSDADLTPENSVGGWRWSRYVARA
jgi:hypothetical protein